ncbi:MAG: hypothetical protein HW410_638 [Nitrosarchaeum sp.]|nr:hypothetical protein [Nitrosarchaeum sp.]
MLKTKLIEPVMFLIIVLILMLFDKSNEMPIKPPIKDISIELIPNIAMNIKATVRL